MVNKLKTRPDMAKSELQEKAPDEGVRKSFLNFFWRLYSENIFRMREDKNTVFIPFGSSPRVRRGDIKEEIMAIGEFIFDEIEKKGGDINIQNFINLLTRLDREKLFNFVAKQHFTSKPDEEIRMSHSLGTANTERRKDNINANERELVEMLNKIVKSGQNIIENSKNPFIEDLLTKIAGKNIQLSQISSEVRFEISKLIQSNKNPLNIIRLIKSRVAKGLNIIPDLSKVKAL